MKNKMKNKKQPESVNLTSKSVTPETQEAVTPETQEAETPETQEAETPETQEAVTPETAETETPETAETFKETFKYFQKVARIFSHLKKDLQLKIILEGLKLEAKKVYSYDVKNGEIKEYNSAESLKDGFVAFRMFTELNEKTRFNIDEIISMNLLYYGKAFEKMRSIQK